MTGCLVPELSCDHCGHREQADAEHTLDGLRRRLWTQGWCKHHSSDQGYLDYCDRDGCCPICSTSPDRRYSHEPTPMVIATAANENATPDSPAQVTPDGRKP